MVRAPTTEAAAIAGSVPSRRPDVCGRQAGRRSRGGGQHSRHAPG